MAKCDKCLRGAHVSVTGVNPSNTLKMSMGGAILYVTPTENGTINVALNAESLLDGDYAYCTWDGERWNITTQKGG